MKGEGLEENTKKDIDNILAKLIFSGNGNSGSMKESHNTFQLNEVIYSSIFYFSHAALNILIGR